MKRYPSWTVTVEGHCDERGTAEYNLALGERRAIAARAYLVSLGIPAGRVRTVSYGKEFPFDPGHNRVGVLARTAGRISSSLRSELMRLTSFGASLGSRRRPAALRRPPGRPTRNISS